MRAGRGEGGRGWRGIGVAIGQQAFLAAAWGVVADPDFGGRTARHPAADHFRGFPDQLQVLPALGAAVEQAAVMAVMTAATVAVVEVVTVAVTAAVMVPVCAYIVTRASVVPDSPEASG